MNYALLNFASPNRSSNSRAISASEALFETRETLAQFLNIEESANLSFTPGCTHSINYVLKGFNWQKGDRVVISTLEHNAVYRPLLSLVKQHELELIILPYSNHKGFEPEILEKHLKEKPVKLIALTHASNVTGELLPVKSSIRLAKEHGAKILIDGSQSVGNFNINLKELDPDFFAFGGHKYLLGPPGTGCLYIKNPDDLHPLIEGGTGGTSDNESMPAEMPDRFEPGTINLPAIWALNSAVSFINTEGLENIYKSKKELLFGTIEALSRIDHLECYSSNKNNIGIIAFNLTHQSPQKVALILDKKYNMATRAGLHCSTLSHKALGTYPGGCMRASLSCFNSKDDLRTFIKCIREISESI
jgi:cysteine desulfurase family protein